MSCSHLMLYNLCWFGQIRGLSGHVSAAKSSIRHYQPLKRGHVMFPSDSQNREGSSLFASHVFVTKGLRRPVVGNYHVQSRCSVLFYSDIAWDAKGYSAWFVPKKPSGPRGHSHGHVLESGCRHSPWQSPTHANVGGLRCGHSCSTIVFDRQQPVQ